MELTNLSILLFFVFIAPAAIGIYLTTKGKSYKWAIAGIALSLALFLLKPIKLDSGASYQVQQSFSTPRAPTSQSDFNPSVDQRYHSSQKTQELEQAKKQFEQRQEN